jgi:membrane protein YqaA with SNARE-associated domain
MKLFLLDLGGLLRSIQTWLIAYGSFGLFAIALLDAALIPLPGGPDVVVMALAHHNHALMPLYVVVATVGSAIGSYFLYRIARRAGEAALSKFNAARRERVMGLVKRYGLLALLLAAVLPPPFPFKIFVLSAGVFRMKLWRFLTALIVGRGFRFTVEGFAAIYYGEEAVELIKQYYPMIGLGVAAAIVVIFLINTLLRRRRTVAQY